MRAIEDCAGKKPLCWLCLQDSRTFSLEGWATDLILIMTMRAIPSWLYH